MVVAEAVFLGGEVEIKKFSLWNFPIWGSDGWALKAKPLRQTLPVSCIPPAEEGFVFFLGGNLQSGAPSRLL